MRSLLSRTTLLAVCVATVAASGCRTPRRSVRVGGDAATLKVSLLNYDAAPFKKEDLIYELSGCLSPTNGAYGEDDVISFTAIGVKKGLVDCQIRVKTVGVPAGIRFLDNTEPNVLFWKKNIATYQNATGGLEAKTDVDKLFGASLPTDPKQAFTLKVPFKLKAPETEKPLGTLLCKPRNLQAVDPAPGAVEGEYTFLIPVAEPTPYECSDLVMNVNGTKTYKGKLEDGKFTAEAGKELSLKQVPVELQAGPTPPPPADDGVKVETQAGECKAGEVFDVSKGECVAQ